MFKHFTYGEFFPACSSSEIAQVVRDPILSSRSIDTLCHLDNLRTYMNEPIIITSGYRDLKHNKRVLGSPTSHHMRATAVDVKNFFNMDKFRSYVDFHSLDFYQVIYYSSWIHIDYRINGEALPFRHVFSM